MTDTTNSRFVYNIKFFDADGFDSMLTVRGDDLDGFVADCNGVKAWAVAEGAIPARAVPQAPAHAAPAPAYAPTTPVQAPANPTPEPAAQAAAPEPVGLERIDVTHVAHAVSKTGKDYINIKGGRWTQYGVSAWPEVLPADIQDVFATWPVNMEYAPPESLKVAYCTMKLDKNNKEVPDKVKYFDIK